MLLKRKRNRRKVDWKSSLRKWSGRLFKLCAAVIAVLSLGLGGKLAWTWANASQRFGLRVLTITGNERATDAELQRIAGLTVGQNLLQLEPAAIEKALLTHPWVKSVTVTRRYPQNLNIDVAEHQASAVVSLGDLYLVNEEGNPFKRFLASDHLDLPIILGLDREFYTDRPQEARRRISLALEALQVWKPAPAEVRTSALGITIVQADGLEVRVGQGDWEAKQRRLENVLKDLKSKNLTAQVIRLDNRMRPERITVLLSRGTHISAN